LIHCRKTCNQEKQNPFASGLQAFHLLAHLGEKISKHSFVKHLSMESFDAHVKCNRDIDLPFVAGLLCRLNSTSKAFARMNFARGNW
jgi:hypothetical protein